MFIGKSAFDAHFFYILCFYKKLHSFIFLIDSYPSLIDAWLLLARQLENIFLMAPPKKGLTILFFTVTVRLVILKYLVLPIYFNILFSSYSKQNMVKASRIFLSVCFFLLKKLIPKIYRPVTPIHIFKGYRPNNSRRCFTKWFSMI